MTISTPSMSKTLTHNRSVSLPNRSHPLIPLFNEHLQRLKPSDNSTPSSLQKITKKLENLENLYNSVDDLLLLPHTQQVFAQERDEKWVDETLDGYLMLVDACSTAKDFVFHAQQNVQDLLSVLRRKRDVNDLQGYLNSRKGAKKMIQKSLKNISSFKNKHAIIGLEKDQETIAIISMLKETESVTIDLIEALLLSVSGNSQRSNGWSLISRLMQSRKSSGNDQIEFEELDAAVCRLVSKCDASLKVDELRDTLREIESSVQIVEERLECLFKRLIRTRVSLLNMMSQ